MLGCLVHLLNILYFLDLNRKNFKFPANDICLYSIQFWTSIWCVVEPWYILYISPFNRYMQKKKKKEKGKVFVIHSFDKFNIYISQVLFTKKIKNVKLLSRFHELRLNHSWTWILEERKETTGLIYQAGYEGIFVKKRIERQNNEKRRP